MFIRASLSLSLSLCVCVSFWTAFGAERQETMSGGTRKMSFVTVSTTTHSSQGTRMGVTFRHHPSLDLGCLRSMPWQGGGGIREGEGEERRERIANAVTSCDEHAEAGSTSG
ncbi:uncharacterized protein BKA78DRAFT_100271 [Phyllosticta capitalensis]|uniref:uncharacterized protein n=1 Tax=Phyllosticta capitalensis TaxID=121624 RepID=UPI00312F89B4